MKSWLLFLEIFFLSDRFCLLKNQEIIQNEEQKRMIWYMIKWDIFKKKYIEKDHIYSKSGYFLIFSTIRYE